MTKRVRFNTGAVNKLTAISMRENIRKQLKLMNVQYTECVQLPYEIKMSEHEYILFCLQWDSELSYQEWRVISL